MKPWLLAGTAIIALAAGSRAQAADMPVKAPLLNAPPVPIAYNWTGCYVGGNVGGAWHTNAGSETFSNGPPLVPGNVFDTATFSNTDRAAVAYGAQGGCNWQFYPHWVAGVEGDYSWKSGGGSTVGQSTTIGGVTNITTINMFNEDRALYSVRGRLGYAWDKWLLYGTAGVAWRKADYNAFLLSPVAGAAINSTVTGPFSNTTTGAVAGLGAEYALADHIIVGGEFLYYAVGKTTTAVAPCPLCAQFGPSTFAWQHDSIEEFRLRLSIKN